MATATKPAPTTVAQPSRAAAPSPRIVPIWALGAAFWVLYLAVFAAQRLKAGNIGELTTFGVIFASIMIEALPFILLGALVSAAMAVYVPDRIFSRIARMPRHLQLPGATLAGFTFPVCECGSVPIGRRLISRGIHPSAGLGFMFSAPILNPIVLISTWVAYGGGSRGAEMVAGRSILGFIVAITAGTSLPVVRGSFCETAPTRLRVTQRRMAMITERPPILGFALSSGTRRATSCSWAAT